MSCKFGDITYTYFKCISAQIFLQNSLLFFKYSVYPDQLASSNPADLDINYFTSSLYFSHQGGVIEICSDIFMTVHFMNMTLTHDFKVGNNN